MSKRFHKIKKPSKKHKDEEDEITTITPKAKQKNKSILSYQERIQNKKLK